MDNSLFTSLSFYLNLKYVMYLQCIWHSYSRNHYFASCIFNFLALIHDINSISILHYISLITTHLNIQRWDAFLAHLSFCIILIFKYFFFIQISFLDLCTSFGDWFSICDLIWLRGFMLYTRWNISEYQTSWFHFPQKSF